MSDKEVDAQTPVFTRHKSKEEEYLHKEIEEREQETRELRRRLKLEEAITELKNKIDGLRWL